MAYLELTFELGARDLEAVEEVCFAAGALSVTLSDLHDDPVLEPAPGEVRLWPATRVQALFAAGSDREALLATLSAALGIPLDLIQARTLEERVWEREWLKDFHAMRFGRRLWVCPRHEDVTQPDAVVVRLDPGLAFGTGTHATTALCLEWLDAYLSPDVRVIDYGCGSGILAIAAVALGAARADVFDIDPQALLATTENAAANGVSEKVVIHAAADELAIACQDAAQQTGLTDVLLANILSGPLCELAPRFATLVRPGGRVVLAGLMNQEAARVSEAYAPWFAVQSAGERDGWTCLAGVRR